MAFRSIDAPHQIKAHRRSDVDNGPDRFRMLIAIDEQENEKTVLTLPQMHPSSARSRIVIGFGAVEFGGQTLDKLAMHVSG